MRSENFVFVTAKSETILGNLKFVNQKFQLQLSCHSKLVHGAKFAVQLVRPPVISGKTIPVKPVQINGKFSGRDKPDEEVGI